MKESRLQQMLRSQAFQRKWVVVFLVLAIMVTAGVSAVLHKTGVAAVYTKRVLHCPYAELSGQVAHIHATDCYDADGNLVCPLQEIAPHTHTEECYTVLRDLVCGQEENPGHIHDDSCYTLTRGELLCADETPEHEHTDDCYEMIPTLSCGMEEGAGAHVHSDACYYEIQRTITCGLQELPEHVHDADCFIDVELTDEEKAALGLLDEEDELVAALDVAGEEELAEGSDEAIDETADEDAITPNPNESIPEAGNPDDTLEDEIKDEEHFETPDSNIDEQTGANNDGAEDIEKTTEEITNEDTAAEETGAAVAMPPASFKGDAGDVRVIVEADEGVFPEGTTMSVEEVVTDEILDAVSGAVDGRIMQVKAVDITFRNADGEEIQPAKPIRVRMEPINGTEINDAAESAKTAENENFQVVHVDAAGRGEIVETPEELTPEETITAETENAVFFDTDHFSVYAFVYSVDLEYVVDGHAYSATIEGADDMLLSDILRKLGGHYKIENVDTVYFTNPELVRVTRLDGDWSIRPLKDTTDEDALIVSTLNMKQFSIRIKTRGTSSADAGIAVISTVDDTFLPKNAVASAEALDEVRGEGAIAAVQSGTETAEVEEGSAEDAPQAEDTRREETFYQVFDISLGNVNPEDYKDGFRVALTLPDNIVGRDFHLYHIHNAEVKELSFEKEAEPTEDGMELVSSVQFETGSFSEFVLQYTVDFYYTVNGQIFQFSLPGGGFVSFTDLVEVLGIVSDTNSDNKQGEDEAYSDTYTAFILGDVKVSDATRKFVADVASVEFSTPTLVDVSRVDTDATVGQIKESRGLKVEYSAELTEEQIAEINGTVVESGDWALISVKPFTSEEELTVTMKNGDTITIRVTDYQLFTNVLTADGKNYKITVTFDDDAEIPAGTKLVAEEIEPGTDEYLQHLGKAWVEVNKEYLEQEEEKKNNIEGLDEYEDIRPVNLDDARFFTISLIFNGEEIEPKASVQIDICYVDGLDTNATAEETVIGAAHFLDNIENTDEEDGTVELFQTVDTVCDEDGKYVEFTYEQDSFSDIGTFVGQKTFDNVPYRMSQVLSMPLLRALSNSTENEAELKDIEAHKSLINNNDGTYTMSLTVKGDAIAYEEYNKANILFVMDRSSSMTSNKVYQPYTGTSYSSSTTYYRKSGDNYEALTLYNGRLYIPGQINPYTGTVYTSVTRLAAEQAAMDVLIKNLLGKNDPDTPGKEDLIEVSVISFASARCSGNTEYLNWTSSDYTGLMSVVNQTSTPKGTNWEDALIYARDQATLKKNAQPDEDVYVIFLTDGEPTAVYGETGGAYHYTNENGIFEGGFEYALTEVGGPYNSHGRVNDGKNSLDRGKEIVDAGYKFYGIFTFNPGDAQTRYLRRMMNFAYTGVDKAYENDSTKEDTDIVKKYFTNADTPEALTSAFEKIFADVSNMLGHGDIVITDGLQAADAMTTTIQANHADGFRYSVTDDTTGNELYYVTATGDDANPTVIFHINGQPYPAGAAKQGVDSKPYYSVTVNGTEYKMALADLSGRELKWDLSAIGMLLPDCTYKVDIIVWPNQDAYDYVAGLNNRLPGYTWDSSVESNPANYHEITVDGVTYGYYTGGVPNHGSIVKYKDTGVFSVLTNTHQELNYSIVNSKTNEVTGETTMTSDPQDPVPLEPQKPMDLVDTNSSFEKQWDIDLDPSILAQLLYPADGSHYTLTFDILQDTSTTPYKTLSLGWDSAQNKYVWESGSERDIEYNGTTYSIGTTWKTDFAVPTGLMLSEERMDALGMDKTAYPSGTFPIDPDHPESGVKTYYILEDGHDYTIKERNLSYEFDFNADVFHPMLVDGEMQNVNFTKNGMAVSISNMTNTSGGLPSLKVENTLRGYIHLQKHVVDDAGAAVDSDKTKFEYTIVLTNEDAPFVGTSIPWYGIDGLYYHDRDYNYYQVYYENNQLKIRNESGTVYPVTNNYDLNNAAEQMLTYLDGGQERELLISGNQTNASNGNKKASATLQISQGEVLSIANVPAGTQYVITESAETGYELIAIGYHIDPNDVQTEDPATNIGAGSITGTIVPNHHNYIDYTNRCLVTDITVQKIDSEGEGLEGAVFQMKKVGSDGHSESDASDIASVSGLASITKTVNGTARTYTSAFETNGQVQTIKGLPDGTYRLYEVIVPAGYIINFRYIEFTIENRVMKDIKTDTNDTPNLDFTEASGNNLALLKINNIPGVPLPMTGGPGEQSLETIGGILMAATFILLVMRKRRLMES